MILIGRGRDEPFGPAKRRGLYTSHRMSLNEPMSLGEQVVILLGVLLLVSAGFRLLGKQFSAEARQERRRRRSNSRIASTAKRPMVRFSVKTRKRKK